jgi:hypothetical protein
MLQFFHTLGNIKQEVVFWLLFFLSNYSYGQSKNGLVFSNQLDSKLSTDSIFVPKRQSLFPGERRFHSKIIFLLWQSK